MDFTEIIILNPINERSINKLFDDIKDSVCEYLLIDVGEHEFESIESMKLLKKRFSAEAELLKRFKKIAFLHPEKFSNISYDEEKYNYFSDKASAIKWMSDS